MSKLDAPLKPSTKVLLFFAGLIYAWILYNAVEDERRQRRLKQGAAVVCLRECGGREGVLDTNAECQCLSVP